MSEENNINNRRQKKRRKPKKKRRFFRTLLILILVLILAGSAVVAGTVLSILDDVPEIDPTNITASLDQTSFILSPDGELIEKIQALESRTVVEIDKMPKHLRDAFVAIEDERFYSHMGVDPRGIISSAVDNVKAGKIVRGASTITQQLVKNVYLTREKSWERKIKEAYLALKVEDVLTKDQILGLYLNRIFLGQNSYGVQEAAQTYFSKDVEDLTIAESALIAGIAKSSAQFAPYETIRPEDFNPEKHDEIARMEMMGETFVAVYNPRSVDRQKLVLNQMLSLGKITDSQYKQALSEDIRASLKPAQRRIEGISSYFTDYIKTQVVETLVRNLDYTKEEAQTELYTGGLKIYSTIDVEMQKKLEDVYNNFTNVLMAGSGGRGPVLIDWRLNNSKDIIDKSGKIIYYTKSNLLNEENNLKISANEFRLENNDLVIKSNKLKAYKKHIDVSDFYQVDDGKNLVTFSVGAISLPENDFLVNDSGELVIKSKYLNENQDFYKIDGNGGLLISNKYFSVPSSGIVQPQSATVILDYHKGEIKAIVGGRDVEGSRILNRASDSQRQPGSVMKPISAYLPALDNGFTAASAIDDIPFYSGGKLWPRNWYRDGYRGLTTLRKSVEQSANVNAVKVVNDVGIKNSLKYLELMGIIDKSNPFSDSFVTAEENPSVNDENLSALGLGGMTKGLTPLEVTAAFGTIANDGVYLEPMSFTKIEDKNGNILIDDAQIRNEVISSQKAYILKDILNTTVTNGIARRAQVPNFATAGKTGTTTNQADIWFVGFTPYYAAGVWIGNDSPAITVTKGSGSAAQLWKHIMVKAHEGLEPKTKFDRPDGIVSASVCRDSGMLASSLCSRDPRGGRVYTEIFAQGTEPKKACTTHVELSIDSATGKIATNNCPPSNVVSKVFIQRKPAYDPSKHNGIVPTDYQYTAPSSTCSHDGSEIDTSDDIDDEDNIPEELPLDVDPNGEKPIDNGGTSKPDSNKPSGENKDKDKDKEKPKDKPKDKPEEAVDLPIDT